MNFNLIAQIIKGNSRDISKTDMGGDPIESRIYNKTEF